ncbi:methyltransferase domain-containing protein, partial [bacterium]|nr:methyltransferase domain-containing protein [candidate division CSSED10-310 bacterium]
HIEVLLRRALADEERGYGGRRVEVAAEALAHLAAMAEGDARAALNALELAVETTTCDGDGVVRVDMAVAEESIQKRAVLYDKDGDAHYDTISAFIKSLRGSDPDAALYWMARMVYAGEEPRFIFRRMLIFAAEDIGMAAPEALAMVESAARAFEYVGLPEGQFHLAQACLYLATAPKSNSAMAYFEAYKAVEQEQSYEVPVHLKDGGRDKKDFGHGAGYKYPHAYQEHWVAQQYLPEKLLGHRFYRPSDQGREAEAGRRLARLRESQAAALAERNESGMGPSTTGPDYSQAWEAWLDRTLALSGERLNRIRDNLLDRLSPLRHELLLDPAAGAGFLVWEALRRLPEGGVIAVEENPAAVEELAYLAGELPDVHRPYILRAVPHALPVQDSMVEMVAARNLLLGNTRRRPVLDELIRVLRPGGRICLYESLPALTPPLHRMLAAPPRDIAEQLDRMHKDLLESGMPQYTLNPDGANELFAAAGFMQVEVEVVEERRSLSFTPSIAAAWLRRTMPDGVPLEQALRAYLDERLLSAYKQWIMGQAGPRVQEFPSSSMCILARKPAAGKVGGP